MRLLSYLLSVLALGFMVFNATKIDFDTPFEKESYTVAMAKQAMVNSRNFNRKITSNAQCINKNK